MKRSTNIRPASHREIQRILRVMDRNHELAEKPDGYLWDSGHDIAARLFDLAQPGCVTYAGMRAAVAELLRHVSPAAMTAVRKVAADEERMLAEFKQRLAAVSALAKLLGIDYDDADKIVEQHEKQAKATATSAEVH